MSKLVELKSVYLRGNRQYRLENINLVITEGEKIALIGSSGSGKSTMISVANGSLAPSYGSALWRGIEIKNLKPRKRSEIGTLWQDLRLIDELNVLQNVNTGSFAKRNLIWTIANLVYSLDINKSLKCLEATGLNKEVLLKSIYELSGGQKQRVAIARIIRQEPDIFLADEPFSNLDPKLVNKIVMLFLGKTKETAIKIPQTILISLHRPELIPHFDRVIGLKNGTIQLDISTKLVTSSQISSIYERE